MINNAPIPAVKSKKYLGMHIDSKLNCEDHIKCIKTKVSRSIGIMPKLKTFVPKNVLKSVCFAFVHLLLKYGLKIRSATYKTHLSKVQRIQNNAIKIASGNSWFEKAKPYYLNLYVLKLQKLKQFENSKFITHEQHSIKLDDYFREISLVSVKETRNSNNFKQFIVRPDTKLSGCKSQ